MILKFVLLNSANRSFGNVTKFISGSDSNKSKSVFVDDEKIFE
jgi:hypothetical protein